MYILWHLKRRLASYRADTVGGVTADAVDARIDDKMSGPMGAVVDLVAADPNSPGHFKAARWLAEFKTFLWLLESNMSGASPSSSDLFDRFQRNVPAASKGVVYAGFIRRIEAATRLEKKWAATYRKRWQASFSRLPVSTPLSDAQLSQRVFR